MSSAYFTKRLKVPDEFPEILKSFTREILRNQPSNIYEFGANYFAEMSAQANMLMQEQDDGANELFSAAEMEEYLSNLFHESDSDGNGYLDPQEFKEIMIAADVGLSEEDIYEIMMVADENGDGKIEYAEFVPIAAETIQALQAREEMERKRLAHYAKQQEQITKNGKKAERLQKKADARAKLSMRSGMQIGQFDTYGRR